MFPGVLHDYTSEYNNDTIIIFLPSVRKKNIYPFYPRQSWKNDLKNKYDLLFLSDPYQNMDDYQTSGGSWYINTSGKSFIYELAQMINDFVTNKGYKNLIFYGSSMGGYTAICLAFLCENSIAIAECPQTILEKHSGSSYVLNKFNVTECLDPISFFRKESQPKSVSIACSIYDHHLDSHVMPFIKNIKKLDFDFSLSTHLFSSNAYANGHVALNKEDAITLIDETYRKHCV